MLGDGHSRQVWLSRAVPFTDTEVARATELHRLATGSVATESVATDVPVQSDPDAVVTQRGAPRDVDALIAMHDRCSAETLLRRYHVPTPRLSPRRARSLLEPADGLSLVMTSGEQVVAVGMLTCGPAGPKLGLLVEDRWQRRGLGTRLLRRLATEAASRGVTSLASLLHQRAELRGVYPPADFTDRAVRGGA